MPDMIVPLYGTDFSNEELRGNIKIVRAMALDKQRILSFVEYEFKNICPEWVFECELALLKPNPSCFIAVDSGKIVGFACYNTSALGMFGPFGVSESYRKNGLGTSLLHKCLNAMKFEGYAYAVIGWVSSIDYYKRAVGALPIPDSFPGVYQRLVKIDDMSE